MKEPTPEAAPAADENVGEHEQEVVFNAEASGQNVEWTANTPDSLHRLVLAPLAEGRIFDRGVSAPWSAPLGTGLSQGTLSIGLDANLDPTAEYAFGALDPLGEVSGTPFLLTPASDGSWDSTRLLPGCCATAMLDGEQVPVSFFFPQGDHEGQSADQANSSQSQDSEPASAGTESGDVGILSHSYGGTTTVTGRITFKGDNTFIDRPCKNCPVELFELDSGNVLTSLTTGTTGANGYFSFTVANVDGSLGIEPVVRFTLDSVSGGARIIDPDGDDYVYTSGKLFQDCHDGTCDVGDTPLACGFFCDAVYLWNSGYISHDRVYTATGDDIPEVAIRYPIDGDDDEHVAATAHYHGGGEIHIGTQRAGNEHVHYHEFGHHAHYEAYDINGGVSWPANDCPDAGHRWGEPSGEICSFREGWADFFSGTVIHSNLVFTGRWGQEVENDPMFIANARNLETRQCEPFACDWAPGSFVEGNVAALFWDVVDTATDDGVDTMDEALGDLWDILLVEDVQTLEDFWENWCGERTVADCNDFEDLAGHNTIFFGTTTESQVLHTVLDLPLGTVVNLIPVLDVLLTDTPVELLSELIIQLLFPDNI